MVSRFKKVGILGMALAILAAEAVLLTDRPAQPALAQTVYYGVNINETSGDVSGYAWSDGIGWIDFNPVVYNPATGEFTGNANIVGITNQGGNGQLTMKGDCTPTCGGYGVTLQKPANLFAGYAWNDRIGWVQFASAVSEVRQTAGDPSVSGWAWNDRIGWISMSNAGQTPPAGTCDASPKNTCLWAWNDSIGWITHNSVDNPVAPKYGMHIDASTGDVSGFIWNDSVGWINLDPTAPFPAEGPAYSVQYDSVTRQLSGWAHIQAYGANGWVKFRDAGTYPYGVSVAANGNFTGFAWNEVIDWIDFAPTGYPAVVYDEDLNPSVNGWAWSDAIGWISTSFVEHDVEYGVNLEDDGRLTGYAWSEIGWIQYDPAGPYPSIPNYSARWDANSGQVSGWARALSMGASYGNGWIKMRSTAADTISYGAQISKTTGVWSGYAWNDVFGWIQYSHPFGAVYTKFPSSGPIVPVLIDPLDNVDTYTLFPSSALTPAMTWSAYSSLDGSTQQAYQIQIDDDPDFSSTVIDETFPSPSSGYTVGLGELSYNVTYYWRVRVQSSNDEWSAWGVQGSGGESNSFRTPLHAPPVCNFSTNPTTPIPNSPTQFTDLTATSGGATVSNWTWDFGDGNTLTGTNPLVHKNPAHTYTTESQFVIRLDAVDSDGYACTKTLDLTVSTILPEFQRVIPR
jgi:hypothetical protein